ncbi:glycosyltransferase family 2 protein [Reichenbachiella agarivorans]|uniref:Glycosyltransferase family 2 protein n=1 Tax=Reichenbachiella agarivorans TaxID=2979464 RepID=A0ABY6CPH8_9BACT|nr:glycosyltransferase family 2 protein [Reichenbachiella agarivorans]UXP32422.1 glycosyltransferase family 2 protein [Reichenbachiella agarivorans]
MSKLPSAYKKFAVLIPGYKEDHVILNSVEKNLEINYPKNNFDLIVIADSFQSSTIEKLVQYPIIIQEVSFEKSTKVKSLKLTINELPDDYDYIVILDADNVMETDYLSKVNLYLQTAPQAAVQTQRWPKNINTDLAILDGISESINNHIYRQGAEATGFSVSLSGSGMIFERNIFQQTISQMDSIGGFDRELEFRLLEQGVKVHYYKEAKVLDQKTDDHGNFQKQRTRWISSQYVYLLRYLGKGFLGLLKGNIVYFHSTVWRNIQLPRLINLGLLTIFTLLAIVLRNYLNISYTIWILLWALNAVSMMIAIPKDLYNKKLVVSILMLPKLFISMLLILFKIKGANKKFIHTEHKAV